MTDPAPGGHYCEHWPSGGRPCHAPATWTIATYETLALRHVCDEHKEALATQMKVPHRLVPISEWLASPPDERPGGACS